MLTGVGAVVPDAQGRILLIRRSDSGQWSLPGGAIDPGEAPAQALVREMWEETGLRVRPVRILGVFGGHRFRYRYPNGDEVEATSVLFECDVVGGTLASRDGEALELAYFVPTALPEAATPVLSQLAGLLRAESPLFEWRDEWLKGLK